MESIKSIKFEKLSAVELENIKGGGLWGKWKRVEGSKKIFTGVCGDELTYQTSYVEVYYNWFGTHATSNTRSVILDDSSEV